MSRLTATFAIDVRLQIKNGFYYAVAFLLTVLLIVITQLPDIDWAPVLPPFLLGNLATATFFFMAGLILLEKAEGTLEAQVVSPLSATEYLLSKLVTLTALSIAESLIIVLIGHGVDFGWMAMTLGVTSAAVLYSLLGFVAVVRYDTINELLFPSMVWVTAFSLPILEYAGLWTSPVMYIHPFQASLVLMKGAFIPLATWEWIYALGYSVLCIGLAFIWSRHAFQRFVVAAVGSGAK